MPLHIPISLFDLWSVFFLMAKLPGLILVIHQLRLSIPQGFNLSSQV